MHQEWGVYRFELIKKYENTIRRWGLARTKGCELQRYAVAFAGVSFDGIKWPIKITAQR
jgi:adenosine deaminase